MTTLEKLQHIIQRDFDVSDVSLETPLTTIGMDSLEFVALMQAVENETGRAIPESSWAAINTVGDIAAAMDKPC